MKKADIIRVSALALAMTVSPGIYAGDPADTATAPPVSEANGPKPMTQQQPGDGPMMQNQQGGMPMRGGPRGRMHPQMMQQMMTMRQQHMQTMETRLANIEALLQQLVELQKQKK